MRFVKGPATITAAPLDNLQVTSLIDVKIPIGLACPPVTTLNL